MPTQVNALKIRVQFQSGPGEAPAEVWTFSGEPDEFAIDEQALDESLFDFARVSGQPSAFMLQRTFSTGGWGASGLSVMEVVVNMGIGVASSAAYAGLVALYKKFTGRAPNVSKDRPPPSTSRAAAKGPPKKKPTGRSKRRR